MVGVDEQRMDGKNRGPACGDKLGMNLFVCPLILILPLLLPRRFTFACLVFCATMPSAFHVRLLALCSLLC